MTKGQVLLIVRILSDPRNRPEERFSTLAGPSDSLLDCGPSDHREAIALLSRSNREREGKCDQMSRPLILIVDDNPENLKLAIAILSPQGYDLRTASDGVQALKLVESLQPVLVLLDLQLPGLDGLSVARQLKANARCSQIPILALTAYAMKGDDTKALAAGCDSYLTKPVDKHVLRSTVAALLAKGVSAAALH
jgi:two-component system cell cycle response regulator DivK